MRKVVVLYTARDVKHYLSAIGVALLLLGCATTPEAQLEQSYKRIAKTPFAQWPYLYGQLEKEGKIDAATRQAWTAQWEVDRQVRAKRQAQAQREIAAAEARKRREWESLSPAQRYVIQMQERQLQQQQEMMDYQAQQQRRAAVAAGLQNIADSYQRQQEVNAYNARTRALQQPVNVNVRGTIDHYGTIYHR